MEPARTELGHLGHPERGAPVAPGRPERPTSNRTRLWHGIRVGLDGPPRRRSVYAIDNSLEQLATARRLADWHGVDDIEWVHGNAESVPQPDASFDFAISEYGAAIWCDPELWIPEAFRLLRSGGALVFLGNHPVAMVCLAPAGDRPAGRTLERPYLGMRTLDWTDAIEDPGGIEFNRPISDWMSLFRSVGFEIEDYVEVRAPESAEGTAFWMPAEWSRQFPSEQVWFLRKP